MPGTKLSLTVTRRDSFLSLPALCLALGLLSGLLVVVVPAGAKNLIQRVRLARLLDRNRRAGTGDSIADLDTWVEKRLAAGADVEDVLGVVAPLLKSGPNKAKAARAELKQTLEAKPPPLGAGHPLAKAALAATTAGNRVEDFLEPDGTTRDQHPAAEWRAGLDRMEEYKSELDGYQKRITDELRDDRRRAPQTELDQARTEWENIAKLEEIPAMDERLEAVHGAIIDALAAQGRTKGARKRLVETADGEERESAGPLSILSPLDLSGTWLTGVTLGAIVLTLVLIAAVVTFAAVTVALAAYDADHTFHSWKDYFALFSAALASGAAGAALTILGYWKTEAPAPEAA